MSAFEWHASLVMTPRTPANEPCPVLTDRRPGARSARAADSGLKRLYIDVRQHCAGDTLSDIFREIPAFVFV